MKQADIQKAFDELNAKYLKALKDLDNALDLLEQQASVADPNADLRNAAKVMAQSELNKEDLSEQEIYDKLLLDQDVGRKIGFWAMPLPKDNATPNTTYTRKS